MILNLNQLRIFHSVASLKSFTRAAEAVHLTQPGISKHISQLEQYYGTLLFERHGRTIVLTKAGEALFEATRDITASLERVHTKIRELSGETPALALAASFTTGLHVLPELLAEFRKQHAALQTTLEIFPARVVEAKLLNHSFEIALVGHEIKNPKLVATEFFSDKLVAIMPPGHRWVSSRRRKIEPKEFLKECFIATDADSGTRITVEDRLRRNGVRLGRVSDFGNMEAVKKAVEAGLGVSILSKKVIERELMVCSLRMLPIVGKDMTRRFFFVRRRGHALSAAAESFVKFISSVQYRGKKIRHSQS